MKGNLFIAGKVHGVARSPLRARLQRFGEGHDGVDHLQTGVAFDAFDSSAARIDIANDDAYEFVGNCNFGRHHRFQQHR